MRTILALLLCLSITASLAQTYPYTFVFLTLHNDRPELPKEELDKIMEGHLGNIQRLAMEGKLLVAGPFDGGGGIYIFDSPSSDSVRHWISTDPGVVADRWKIEMFAYQPRVGSVCVVDPDAELVNYTFIRYITTITKFNVHQADVTFDTHDEYLRKITKTGNVVTEGIFANRDGGILIMKGSVDKELIESDPSMKDTIFRIEHKKVWLGKGSFCEK
ncbi:MAG: YciI family protein [Cyclobacteriaceae bacterium]